MTFFSFERYRSGAKISVLGFDIEARTLHGRDAEDSIPYMSQLIIGSLRLHIFWRGDEDPDPHDHPWSFWTFPLTSYREEVTGPAPEYRRSYVDVTAFHLHHRPATYTHRVLYKIVRRSGWEWFTKAPGPIVTIVWTGQKSRSWGFLKSRDGKWCWVAWRDYIFNGGKNGPCE